LIFAHAINSYRENHNHHEKDNGKTDGEWQVLYFHIIGLKKYVTEAI
jgi:hypothetical protein